MPWEIIIARDVNDESLPLGMRREVLDIFAGALPGVTFENPPLPPKESLNSMSPFVRDTFLRPKLVGDYNNQELSIHFTTWDLPEIRFMYAEVRGSGNPLPVLAKLCMPNGWFIISAYDKSIVDLSKAHAPQWEHFQSFRDRAFQSDA